MSKRRFLFCPKCGGRLNYQLRHDRERLTCGQCGYVFYENPVVGVATIIRNETGEILLGRRASASTYPGLWCIPCGYVEYDEDVYDAARRECREETGLIVDIVDVFTVLSNFHNPDIQTVGIWFNTRIVGGKLAAGDDIDKVGYFALDHHMPQLAFPTDCRVVEMLRERVHGLPR